MTINVCSQSRVELLWLHLTSTNFLTFQPGICDFSLKAAWDLSHLNKPELFNVWVQCVSACVCICDREMFIFARQEYMVVVLVSVWKCSRSRADSYRQCSSLTALLCSDYHPWRKTHRRRKSLTVILKQTHTHTITESSDSLGVSLTHTSVIVLHLSQFSAAGLNVL